MQSRQRQRSASVRPAACTLALDCPRDRPTEAGVRQGDHGAIRSHSAAGWASSRPWSGRSIWSWSARAPSAAAPSRRSTVTA